MEKNLKIVAKLLKNQKVKIELFKNAKSQMEFELCSLNLEKVAFYAFNLSFDEAIKKHDFNIKIKGDELKNEFIKNYANYANLLEKE